MNAHSIRLLQVACATAIAAAIPLTASAQSVLSLHDEATGATRVFTESDSAFLASGDGKSLDVDVAIPGVVWSLRFEAPHGASLAPGPYRRAGCPYQLRFGRSPGLGITNNNPVCNFGLGTDTLWGSFVIRQIAYDGTGQLTALEAVFTQRQGSPTAPALGGLIRYQARPLSLALRSDAGFAWGPIAQRNHGDTGLFTLDGTTSDGIDYTASVRKDLWRMLIVPPNGRSLATGRYPTRTEPGAAHAGFMIRRGLDQPMDCENGRGVLDIRKLRTDPGGSIIGLHANFEYRCGGTRPALRGTIRFHE